MQVTFNLNVKLLYSPGKKQLEHKIKKI
jgi:hypothetical protein